MSRSKDSRDFGLTREVNKPECVSERLDDYWPLYIDLLLMTRTRGRGHVTLFWHKSSGIGALELV